MDIVVNDHEDSWCDDEEWEDEDHLVQDGKLIGEVEGYENHWSCKNCLGLRENYIQYLLLSENIWGEIFEVEEAGKG